MSTELQKLETNVVNWECSQQLKTIKEIYGKKLTNEEFSVFVNLGKATGLNPFLREIWAIKYGDAAASIFIGRDGYRKSAQSNQNYDYHFADAVYSNDNFQVINGEVSHTYKITDRGQLMGAYCLTKRKSSSRPIFVYVELKEYDKNQSNWKTMKTTMIKKVAESQCLRMAFQELFSGTYSEEEYTPEDNSPEAKNIKSKNHIASLIQGKSERIFTMDELVNIIKNSKELDDLKIIPQMVSNLSEEEKGIIRSLYRDKEIWLKQILLENINKETGEIKEENQSILEYEKIKKQLLNAKSLDTLVIAADLIRTVDEDKREELTKIYNNLYENME